MKTRFIKIIILVLFIFGSMTPAVFAAPNANSLPNFFLRHVGLGGFPNHNAAFFKFLNPTEDPIARQISLGTAFSGLPVELDTGEPIFASIGWLMFFVDDCESQVVRKVVNFNSPQCLVPDPEETDPDTVLSAIASLPKECLDPPAADACAVFEGPLRFDFGTSQVNARRILQNEIIQTFELDGTPLPPDQTRIKLIKYGLSPVDPDHPSFVCSDELYYSPIYAYFAFGYQIPPQTGGCISKSSGVLLPPLTPGEHEFLFHGLIGDIPDEFPPVTIIQH